MSSISNKKWAIVLSSDLHFGSVHSSHGIDIRDDKRNHVQKIIDMKDEHNVEIVISAGDITDYGTNGICCFCSNNNNNSEDELTPLINNWVKPLENAGLDVLLTAGNHDTYTGHPYFHKPVLRYLKKKYNATYWPWFWMKYNGCYAYSKNNVLILEINNYGLLVTGNQLRLLGSTGTSVTSGGDGFYTGANEPSNFDPFETFGPAINWKILLDQYGKVRNDTSQIRLMQPNGNEIIGTIAVNSLEDTILLFNIDQDTIPANTLTAVKKIINPATFDPGTPVNADRYLIINDVGDSTSTFTSDTWGTLVANVGDIIEYNSSLSAGSRWVKAFDASHPDSTQHYVTNSHTGIQYRFNGTEWVKSYEGIYTAGNWSIVLDGGASPGYNASTDATTP